MLHTDLPPPSGGGGGVRHQVARLSQALAARGHEVVVHVLAPSDGNRSYAVRQTRLGGMCGDSRLARIALASAAFASESYSGFDIIHAHGDSELLIRRRIPIVRTFYGSAADEARYAINRKQRVLQRWHHVAELMARQSAWRTVGISQATADSIGELDQIIPCGVDRDHFRPGSKTDAPTILFIGTMRGRKRGDLVARVFRDTILPRLPDARLIMVAPDVRSEEGVEAVTFASDELIAHYLRSAWVFTLPSTYEGFGVPYIEAMASGTAVVATPNAGAKELFRNGGGGTLVSDADLGDSLLSLLTDDLRRTALAARGRAISERFDWSQIASRYEDVYREVTEA